MPTRSITPPTWLQPGAIAEKKRFHTTLADVWIGDVDYTEICGWIGNPRTEMHARQFQESHGREPTDDEMFATVLTDEESKESLHIRELAKSIYQSQIRVPLVLTRDKKLLDGNRRYYANLLVLREIARPTERDGFRNLPAVVLADEISPELEDAIMTEYNFKSDYRQSWPYYVKAFRVYADHNGGMTKVELKAKYDQEWRNLSKWIKAAELCDYFLEFHDHSVSSERFAYENLIIFDEMMRRYPRRFDDRSFREAIFELLLDDYDDDNHRIRGQREALHLDHIYDSREAWDALKAKRGKDSLTEAELLLKMNSIDVSIDPNPKLKRLVSAVEKLGGPASVSTADPELLSRLHELVNELPGQQSEPRSRVEKMVAWLDCMTSLQIATLDSNTLAQLREALDRVLRMAEAVVEKERR
jgi:hypothetical protein